MDSVSQRKVWLCDPPRGLTAKTLHLRDLKQVKLLGDLSFSKRWSESDYQYFLTSESGRCYGLEKDGVLLAYTLCLLAQGDLDIVSVATHPEWRKKSLALWMMGVVPKMQEVKRAYLEVDAENLPAIKLYEKSGFRHYGVRKKYYEGKRDALLMQKVF